MNENEIRKKITDQKLLSICIPTWNRAPILEKTLNNVISQALEFKDKVEICVSNNASTDNTKEVVMKFKEKYPDLIKYNENEKNLGCDRNILKVISMAEGRFAWPFGDRYFIVNGGLKEVINFIESIKDKDDVGVAGVKHHQVMVDEKNDRKVKWTWVYKNKPDVFELSGKNMIEKVNLRGIGNPIFNNKLLKNLFQENYELIEKGIGGLYMHSWLYCLIFILHENLKCYVLNKAIFTGQSVYPKPIIEDYFRLAYAGNIKFYERLESISRDNGRYEFANIFNGIKKKAKMGFVHEMMFLKTFNMFAPLSYFGCIRLFYCYLEFIDALLFSLSFLVISITPSLILRMFCKTFLKIKFGKKAESVWKSNTEKYPLMCGAKRRLKYFQKGWASE